MNEKDVLDAYKNALAIIEKNGLDYYKCYISENKNISMNELVIATSIISGFELIGKK